MSDDGKAIDTAAIEDGEEAIVEDLVELLSRASDRAAGIMRRIAIRLEELNRRIDAHNRYHPILPHATIEGLTERASRRRALSA